MEKITIIRPDDWHIHLRDDCRLNLAVEHVSRYFGRALVMPNLIPPLTTYHLAKSYYSRIQSNCSSLTFSPFLTLYLTDNTSIQDVKDVAMSDFILAFKLYPKKVTTNSEAGVSSLENLYPIFSEMQKLGVVLCLHGEQSGEDIDPFDREKYFIDKELRQLVEHFPDLKIVFEHITTQEACDFISATQTNIAATITPQHLMFNRSDLLSGGVKPHLYCLPILKRSHHQEALISAATSGKPQFFLGTDSAPHIQSDKESSCGCAGCYSGHASLEMYVQVFEQQGALSKLEGFASIYGSQFYGLTKNEDKITLVKKSWEVPDFYEVNEERIVPLLAGQCLQWQVLS